jgi:hypothetical protein
MRTQVINQMKALVITAPDDLRSRRRQLTNPDLVAVSTTARPGLIVTPIAAAKMALRSLAIRHLGLTAELEMLDRDTMPLQRRELLRLTAVFGARAVGPFGPSPPGLCAVTSPCAQPVRRRHPLQKTRIAQARLL